MVKDFKPAWIYKMKTILLVLFYVLTICQSEPVFLEEGRSFDADPTKPTNTVNELWIFMEIYFFFQIKLHTFDLYAIWLETKIAVEI